MHKQTDQTQPNFLTCLSDLLFSYIAKAFSISFNDVGLIYVLFLNRDTIININPPIKICYYRRATYTESYGIRLEIDVFKLFSVWELVLTRTNNIVAN